MKKQLLSIIALALAALSGNAIEPGYRGFVDYGFLYGTGDFDGSTMNEISTTHGYQILPQLFVGGGVGVHLYKFGDSDGIHYNLPVFADIRWDILQSKFTPFIDMRGGYSVAGEFTGAYINPSIGCRMGIGDKFGLNLGVGYTYMQTGYAWESTGSDLIMQGVNIKLAFDF